MAEPAITVQAYHVSSGSNFPITRVVIHDEEVPVSDTSAEGVANYFASSGSGGSAHYVEDQNSEQHCVAENAIAWHAPPNQGSIGIEMDGYARFTTDDWAQPGSEGSLKNAALRTADLCDRYGLPVVWLSVDDLLAGKKGITSHANVSAAFRQSDHTDPGMQFPISHFLNLVNQVSGTQPVEIDVPNEKGFVASPTGGGWVFGTDGGIFTVGSAQFYGSMGGKQMNAPIVGMVPTPRGKGYALVGADGGMFNFGDAKWNAYGPLATEYQQGQRHIVGACLQPRWNDADQTTWHAILVSNHLETYVL